MAPKSKRERNANPEPILIIGGTTEGRIAIKVCDEASSPFYYSTKGEAQQIEAAHAIRLTGALTGSDMEAFCRDNNVRIIVDAAHPFAMGVHTSIGEAADKAAIPIIRFERDFPSLDPRLLYFDTYADAINYLEQQGLTRLLALTGVNTIKPMTPYWRKHEAYFRIMQREDSLEVVRANSFPLDKIIFYEEERDDTALIQRIKPQAVITKESGESGGFTDKVEAALALGVPVLVVRRPVLPYTPSETVYGRFGLRRAIERLHPDFFPLHTGYTTGTCATAATAAALYSLLTGEKRKTQTILLPGGEPITIPIQSIEQSPESCKATVIKYSGDDPDVTNGTEICSEVRLSNDHNEVRFLQGIGVGVVTLPGLGLEIGGPAINTTPKAMMTREAKNLIARYADEEVGVEITISVPQGAELAQRTFNPRLGVLGGISIIGSSGIIQPFSSEAFVNSIKAEIRVARSLNAPRLVINSGAKSEAYLKALYPELPPQAFVHYGNFIGETIKAAAECGCEKITMGVMIGKAVKLAEGLLDTHSKKAVMNKEFIRNIAQEAGSTQAQQDAIEAMTLARELWSILPLESHPLFYQKIKERCHAVCAPLLPQGELSIYLITEEGTLV